MITKVAVLLGLIAATSGNPAAGKPWHWKSPRPLIDPIGPEPIQSRIVGGYEATPHAWPHQVALFIDGGSFCGGSLISNQWVLTAAHCMDGVSKVEVVMGAHNIRQNEATQVTMTSYNHFVHENWNSWLFSNDIALIKLPSPVQFNAYISAVSLPSSRIPVGTYTTPSGWGKPSDNAFGISKVLRQVDVPVISNTDCNSRYGNIREGMICTDATGGRGTCNGDSGGPLNQGGMTHGITSFGSNAGCEKGWPDVFTSVAYYRDWIRQKTGV